MRNSECGIRNGNGESNCHTALRIPNSAFPGGPRDARRLKPELRALKHVIIEQQIAFGDDVQPFLLEGPQSQIDVIHV
jgi:hypothetical protein